jgi:hypothetical protein
MFKDVSRVTFDVPSPRVLLLLSYSYRRLRGKLGLEEGEPGLLRNYLFKTATPKTLADEVKEAIKKRVDDIDN